MLHRVREFGMKGAGSEPGFKPQDIRWVLVFTKAGEFLGVKELGDASQKNNPGQRFPKCPRIDRAGKAVWSQFLWDDLGTLLCWGKDEKETIKASANQPFFLDRLREASSVLEALDPCARSLAQPETASLAIVQLKAAKAKSSHYATIEIDGNLPLDSEDLLEWWRGNRERIVGLIGKGPKKQSSGEMRCLLTGELTLPARIHPFIQRMTDVGGNAKSALVSFNEAAYCSYGLGQSVNAAVSEQAATAYADALNQLISDRSRRLISYRYIQTIRKGKPSAIPTAVWMQEPPTPGQDAKAVLWFDKYEVNEALDTDILLDPSPFEGAERREASQAGLRGLQLLGAIRRGERPDLVGAHYFCAILSSATSRVMVRDWQEGPLTQFADAILQWFSDLEIADIQTGEKARDPAFALLVGAMARKKKDVAPSLVLSLWLAATQQRPIPDAIMAQVLKRLRIEIVTGEMPRREAAALLKACLLRSARRKGENMENDPQSTIREDHPDPAYQCGRLMAALAALQKKALGDVGAGVIQRYYSAASATPSLVFGRLIRNSQNHLDKLLPGLRSVFEGRIASIAARIGDQYPKSLGLEGQSMFALGYYQQIAENRRMQQINKAKKEQQTNG